MLRRRTSMITRFLATLFPKSTARRVCRRRLWVEALEERALLAAIVWDGGGNNTSWADPLNWDLDRTPGMGDDVSIVNIGASTTVVYSAAAGAIEFDSVRISSGVMLVMPGTTTLTANDLTVEAGGWIRADGQGYGVAGGNHAPGQGPGAGARITNAAGGGGHGGVGGLAFDRFGASVAGGVINDSAPQPTLMGSSGGSASQVLIGSQGGAGGGAIRLVVSGTLTVDGQVTSHGGGGQGFASGGGAGGSIWVTTGTLAGNGIFAANGGAAGASHSSYGGGGGGGGGRIAVYYSQDAGFNFAGSTAMGGAAGTQFSSAGAHGTVGFIDESEAGGHLHVYTTYHSAPAGTISFGAVTVHNGAILLLPGTTTLTANNLTVDAGGWIRADGQGYGVAGGNHAPGQGPGAGASITNASGGGGHGGAGGFAFDRFGVSVAGGVVNDSLTQPSLMGSSGGSAGQVLIGSQGGAGGGAIRLVVSGTLTVNGQITSHGSGGAGIASGGGAGGSIWVTTGILAGSGVIAANGGAAGASHSSYGGGGGGGGGRIALYYSINAYTGALSVNGGAAGLTYSSPGAVGTIYIFQTNQPPVADAGGPYLVKVGSTVQLNASGTTDDGSTLDYQWDLDGDGIFGETGTGAERGDEIGVSPTFNAASLGLRSSVTVDLRVTDVGGLIDHAEAEIEVIGIADLMVRSSGVTFTPVHPDDGELFTIDATVTNQGLAAVSGMITVTFYDFQSPLIPLGTATIAGLAPGQTVVVHSPEVSFPESYRLFTIVVDGANLIEEMNENNNKASQVLQVGDPSLDGAPIMVVTAPAEFSAGESQALAVTGHAYYDFPSIPGTEDFPVQGGNVTVTAAGRTFMGSHTDDLGNLRQGILAADTAGSYALVIEVHDHTTSAFAISTLFVENSPSLPPLPTSPPSGAIGYPIAGGGTSSGGGGELIPGAPPQPGDVFIYSEDIVFSHAPQGVGEPISIFAFVQYKGDVAVSNVLVTINDIFPVSGELYKFPISSSLVNFKEDSDNETVFTVIEAPWINTAEGIHIIQVNTVSPFTQFTGNDNATRLVNVGTPSEVVEIDKQVTLLVDADGDSVASPGDTLRYSVTITNNGPTDLTNLSVFDDYEELLLQTPTNISDEGAVVGGTVVWEFATFAIGLKTMVFDAQIKPSSVFPGGITSVVNTVVAVAEQAVGAGDWAIIDVFGDRTPATTTATFKPTQSFDDWRNTDVEIVLSAVDNVGGSGVNRILYSINGGPVVTIDGNTVNLQFTDEGIHTLRFQSIDNAGNIEAPQTIEIKIDKTLPLPFDDDSSADSVAEGATNGTTVGITALANDSHGPAVSYSLTDDAGGRFAIDAATGAVTVANGLLLNYEDAISHTISVLASDAAGRSSSQSFTISLTNLTPTTPMDADIATNNVSEGAANGAIVGVTAASTDSNGTAGGGGAIYHLTDDAGGRFAINSGTGVVTVANGQLLDGPSVHTITVQSIDGAGGASTASFVIHVTNLAPNATDNSYATSQGIAISGNFITDDNGRGVDTDPSGTTNDPLSISSYTNPSNGTLTVDSTGNFTYTPSSTFAGTDSFIYTVSDGDGGFDTATVTIIVAPAAAGSIRTIYDSCMGGTALFVMGTSAGDEIQVTAGATSDTVNVSINGIVSTHAKPSGRIIVVGGVGDDNIQIAGTISNFVWLYGDAGNDRLNAGNGGGLLIGGDGDDQLLGGNGRDVMVGGQGADRITGNGAADILVAGFTDRDDRSSPDHDEFWCHVLEEWNSANSFAVRVLNLRNGTGGNVHNFDAHLLDHVFDDTSLNQVDFLNGNSGDDWLLFRAGEDKVSGQIEASN